MDLSDTLSFEKGECDTYFAEYGEWNVHELMLKDQVRTATYRRAIEENAAMFKGWVILERVCVNISTYMDRPTHYSLKRVNFKTKPLGSIVKL